MKIYFDGGAKPNPGALECAVVSDDGSIKHHSKTLGHGTNNEAEWIGFLWAVGLAAEMKGPVEIVGDSLLVINQAKGSWKCNKENLQGFLKQFREFPEDVRSRLKLTQVPRKINLAGIFIEQLQK
jgi:ribonuclease HI